MADLIGKLIPKDIEHFQEHNVGVIGKEKDKTVNAIPTDVRIMDKVNRIRSRTSKKSKYTREEIDQAIELAIATNVASSANKMRIPHGTVYGWYKEYLKTVDETVYSVEELEKKVEFHLAEATRYEQLAKDRMSYEMYQAEKAQIDDELAKVELKRKKLDSKYSHLNIEEIESE